MILSPYPPVSLPGQSGFCNCCGTAADANGAGFAWVGGDGGACDGAPDQMASQTVGRERGVGRNQATNSRSLAIRNPPEPTGLCCLEAKPDAKHSAAYRRRFGGRLYLEERTLSHALTLQCDQVIFILEPSGRARAAIGKRATVVDHPDGRMSNGRDSDIPIWWRHDSGASDAVEQTAGLLVGQQLPVLG